MSLHQWWPWKAVKTAFSFMGGCFIWGKKRKTAAHFGFDGENVWILKKLHLLTTVLKRVSWGVRLLDFWDRKEASFLSRVSHSTMSLFLMINVLSCSPNISANCVFFLIKYLIPRFLLLKCYHDLAESGLVAFISRQLGTDQAHSSFIRGEVITPSSILFGQLSNPFS